MYEDTVLQLETSPAAAKHPKLVVRSTKTEDSPHLISITPLKVRQKSLCEKEITLMLSCHLVYRHLVLLLRCSTMDLVMVLVVIISPESL